MFLTFVSARTSCTSLDPSCTCRFSSFRVFEFRVVDDDEEEDLEDNDVDVDDNDVDSDGRKIDCD